MWKYVSIFAMIHNLGKYKREWTYCKLRTDCCHCSLLMIIGGSIFIMYQCFNFRGGNLCACLCMICVHMYTYDMYSTYVRILVKKVCIVDSIVVHNHLL